MNEARLPSFNDCWGVSRFMASHFRLERDEVKGDVGGASIGGSGQMDLPLSMVRVPVGVARPP